MINLQNIFSELQLSPVLREKLVTAQAEISALQHDYNQEKSTLNIQIEALKSENKQLKEQIRAYEEKLNTNPADHDSDLDSEYVAVLVALGNGRAITSDELARALRISEPNALSLLEDLEEQDFVSACYNSIMPTVWELDRKGRRYLRERNCL